MRQTTEAGFAGDITPRAVLPSLIGWLMMLGIMAGMVQIHSYALLWQWHVRGWYCWCHSCCMPVVCNDRCRVVDDLAQFIDGCGRPVLMLRRELGRW